MLHEYGEIVSDIKLSNAHFAKIFEKHDDLNQQISDVEEGREHMEQLDLDKLKKEKLRLKDEAYSLIMAYKQEKGM